MNAYFWKQTLRAEGEPVLTLSLRRPDLSSAGGPQRRIEAYYKKIGESWRRHWETELFSAASDTLHAARAASRPFQPWSAALDFTVTREDNEVLSLYMDAVVQGCTPHRLIVRSADTWDWKTGMPQNLSHFLPHISKKKKTLLTLLRQRAAEQLAGGESLFFHDVETRMAQYYSPQRFYLTENGPILFYPMLALGPSAEGIPAFSIS